MWRFADAFRGNSKPKDAGYVKLDSRVDSREEKKLKTRAKAEDGTLDDRILYCEFIRIKNK